MPVILNSTTIMQQNVLNWRTNKYSHTTYYRQVTPDMILIDSHELKSKESLKIPGYTTYAINSTESNDDGSAIPMKYNIKHKILMILTHVYLQYRLTH